MKRLTKMSRFRTTIFTFYALLIIFLAQPMLAQDGTASLEDLVDLLGRSEYSPKVEEAVSQFNLTKGESDGRL